MSESLAVALPAESAELGADRLAALFDRHQARLYRLARRMSGDAETAHDLVQETFLRAARRRRLPAGDSAQEAWLVRVLVNLCRDRWRRREVRLRLRDRVPVAPAPPDPETAAVARATVQAALSRLAPRRRAILVLHELDGLPAGRIARLLRLRPATVRWHLSVGRRELSRLLSAGTKEQSDV